MEKSLLSLLQDNNLENVAINSNHVVKYVPLIKVCTSLKSSILKTTELDKNGKYPVINSGKDIYGYYNDYNNEGNAICIASRGNAGYVSYIGERFWAGGLCYPYRSRDESVLITKFLYYYLKNNEELIMTTLVSKGGVPAINKSDINNFPVPILPYSCQKEIVRILNKFTELDADLKAELNARKKQYFYYLNKILNCQKYITHSQQKKLGQCCEIRSGWGFPVQYQGKQDCDLPFYKVSDMNKEENTVYMQKANNYISSSDAKLLKCKPVPQNTIIFPKIGAAIGTNKKRITKILSCYDNNIVGLIPGKEINYKYLYYLLETIDLMSFAEFSGALPSIRKSTLEQFEIFIPPIEEQERCVDILDRFNNLCCEIAAEIVSRRKQYEYYRDKLLTFKEKSA